MNKQGFFSYSNIISKSRKQASGYSCSFHQSKNKLVANQTNQSNTNAMYAQKLRKISLNFVMFYEVNGIQLCGFRN